jgi:hypothetical protein
MGANFASDLASGEFVMDLETQMSVHLSSNHYPPVPSSMVAPCIAAIHACNGEGESETDIELPEGILWKGAPSAPAWAIVDGYHLDAWIECEFEDDAY